MRFQATLVLATLALVSGATRNFENGRTGLNMRPEASEDELDAKREEIQRKRLAAQNNNNNNNKFFRGHPDIEDIADPEVRGMLAEKRLEKMKRLQSLQNHKIIDGKVVASPVNKDENGSQRKLARLNYW